LVKIKPMKYTFLLFSCIFGISANAQFNQSNEASIGQNSLMFSCDSSVSNYAGVTGTGVTWDYSQLLGYYGQTRDLQVIDAATSTFNTIFTTSTKGFKVQNAITNFFNSTATERTSQGFVYEEPTLGVLTADFSTNNEKMMNYPYALGNSLTDTFDGMLSFSYAGQPQNPSCSGNVFTTVDGQGTLLLPGGTSISNVLRYRTTDSIFATVNFLGNNLPIELVRNQYEYYDLANSTLPVFMYTRVIIQAQGGTTPINKQTIVLSSVLPTAFVGLENTTMSNISMYPNPSEGNIRFSGLTGQASIEIIDLSGKKVFSQHNILNATEILTGNLDKGMYTVLLHDATGVHPMTLCIR
jgi:hypothetical protein